MLLTVSAGARLPDLWKVHMTDLARSRGDQFIDLLGEFTAADDQPEPGYRRQAEPDWLSEFADEENPRPRSRPRESIQGAAGRSAPDALLLADPPMSLQLEPEATTRATSGRFAALGLMVLLAAVSTSIVLITPITRPGDLPDVHNPALAEAAVPPLPSPPRLDAVPRAPQTTTPAPISGDPGPNPRHRVRATQEPGHSSLPVSGSSPREVETAAVQNVLERYRASYSTLSTAGIEAVWPGADRPALARAFDRLQSLQFDFQSCGVELFEGGRATARCRGRAIFVPKGDRSERVESRAWSFQLSRVTDGWTIVSVESR